MGKLSTFSFSVSAASFGSKFVKLGTHLESKFTRIQSSTFLVAVAAIAASACLMCGSASSVGKARGSSANSPASKCSGYFQLFSALLLTFCAELQTPPFRVCGLPLF